MGSAKPLPSLAEHVGSHNVQQRPTPFGDFRIDWPADAASMTLAAATGLEYLTLENALRRAYNEPLRDY